MRSLLSFGGLLVRCQGVNMKIGSEFGPLVMPMRLICIGGIFMSAYQFEDWCYLQRLMLL